MKSEMLRIQITVKQPQKIAAVINTLLDTHWDQKNKILASVLLWAGWTTKDGWWRP